MGNRARIVDLPDTVRAYLASRLRPDEMAHVDRLLAAADAAGTIERRATARKAAASRKAKASARAERRAWRRGLAELRARIKNRNSMDLKTTTPRDPEKVSEALAGGAGGQPDGARRHGYFKTTNR